MQRPPPHRFISRSTRQAAFAAGITIAVTSSILLASECLMKAKPVQAFSRHGRAAGAATFHEKGCEHCHGVEGIGTDRGPELSDIGKRWKKDRIELQILNGGGGMPPFADALQADEVRDLVDYLKAMRRAPTTAKPMPTPNSSPASSDDSGL